MMLAYIHQSIIEEDSMVNIFRAFKNDREHSIKVGYFRNGKSGTTIADIAKWNEFGTYVAPPRPFIRNTIAKNRKKWLKDYIELSKKFNFMLDAYIYEFADRVRADLIAEIKNGDFKPNAPITIEGGWMANRKSKKPFRVEGKGNKRPLSNRDGLVNSIEIRVGDVK